MLRLICNENVVSFVSRSVGLVICTQALHHLVRPSQDGVLPRDKEQGHTDEEMDDCNETLSK